MKKRLLCLAVSLLMAIQMLGEWPASAVEAEDAGGPESPVADASAPDSVIPEDGEDVPVLGEEEPDFSEEPILGGEEPAPEEDASFPAAYADRVAAENSFATDLFCVETLAGGVTYRLEHWDPNGANGLCLWTGVVSVAAPSNGGWKLKPASNGHYYFITSTNALTASSETAVVTEAYASGNEAQLWNVEPVADGDG